MPCFYPLDGWWSKDRHPQTGKRRVVFRISEALTDRPIQVPCGQCTGCRLERSRQWAIRCMHEAQLYDNNCFITLTYNDKHLPAGKTLVLADFQKFMKRLRKYFPQTIRFFHCGEYGDLNERPHYHACLFNCDFPDRRLYKTVGDHRLYTSAILDRLWSVDGDNLGFATIGDVSFESAAYVARYVMKKVNGEKEKEHYGGRLPEYCTMSRRPGLGSFWIEKYKDDVYPFDGVITRGFPSRPPRFYDLMFEHTDPDVFRKVRRKRMLTSKDHKWNQTSTRHRVREVCTLAKIKRLERQL